MIPVSFLLSWEFFPISGVESYFVYTQVIGGGVHAGGFCFLNDGGEKRSAFIGAGGYLFYFITFFAS
jgi:hypothetical protein